MLKLLEYIADNYSGGGGGGLYPEFDFVFKVTLPLDYEPIPELWDENGDPVENDAAKGPVKGDTPSQDTGVKMEVLKAAPEPNRSVQTRTASDQANFLVIVMMDGDAVVDCGTIYYYDYRVEHHCAAFNVWLSDGTLPQSPTCLYYFSTGNAYFDAQTGK